MYTRGGQLLLCPISDLVLLVLERPSVMNLERTCFSVSKSDSLMEFDRSTSSMRSVGCVLVTSLHTSGTVTMLIQTDYQ